MAGVIEQFTDRAWEIIQKLVGMRLSLELIVLFLCGAGTVFLVSHRTTSAEFLAGSAWVVIAIWYFWIVYRGRFHGNVGKLIFFLPMLTLIAWSGSFVAYLTSAHREITRAINLAQEFGAKGLYRDAASSFEDALSLARKFGDKKSEMECVCALGVYRQILGPPEAARTALHSCLALAVELNDSGAQGRALDLLGDLEQELQNNDLAKRYYADARELLKEEGTTSPYDGAILLAMGQLEGKKGNYDLARRDYEDAQALFQKAGQRLGEAQVVRALGELEGLAGHRDMALRDYDEARALFRQEGFQLGEAGVLVDLGQLEFHRGEEEDARRDFEEARGLSQKLSDAYDEGNALVGLANLEARSGNQDAARQNYQEPM